MGLASDPLIAWVVDELVRTAGVIRKQEKARQ
jgi:hypothetical protein